MTWTVPAPLLSPRTIARHESWSHSGEGRKSSGNLGNHDSIAGVSVEMRNLKCLAMLAAMPLAAADPRIGTWQFLSSHGVLNPEPQAVITARENGLEYLLLDRFGAARGTVEGWIAKFDGRDYPITGTLYDDADHVSLRRVDKNSIEVTMKRAGQVLATSRWTVSEDGSQMTRGAFLKPGTKPSPSRRPMAWRRTGRRPEGTDPFVGTWERDNDKIYGYNDDTDDLVFTEEWENGVRCSSGKESFVVRLDGKDYSAGKMGGGETIAARLADQHTVEETYKFEGKVYGTGRWLLSSDGRRLVWTMSHVLYESAGHRMLPHGEFHQIAVYQKRLQPVK